jgi:hypothetical protein
MARQLQNGPASAISTRRRLLRWSAGGGAALAGAVLTKGLSGTRVEAQAPAGIVGSWVISFPQGSSPGSDPNERQVTSFTSDGIMINSSSPSSPPDPQQGPDATRTYSTPGQGVWVASGNGTSRFKFVSVDTDEQGNFMDMAQITGTVTLGSDGNSFNGNFQVLVTAADGSVIFDSQGDAGTVVGKRITV